MAAERPAGASVCAAVGLAVLFATRLTMIRRFSLKKLFFSIKFVDTITSWEAVLAAVINGHHLCALVLTLRAGRIGTGALRQPAQASSELAALALLGFLSRINQVAVFVDQGSKVDSVSRILLQFLLL